MNTGETINWKGGEGECGDDDLKSHFYAKKREKGDTISYRTGWHQPKWRQCSTSVMCIFCRIAASLRSREHSPYTGP